MSSRWSRWGHAALEPCHAPVLSLQLLSFQSLWVLVVRPQVCAAVRPHVCRDVTLKNKIRKIIKDIHTPWCIVVKGGGIVRESYFRCPLIHGPYFTCCVSSLSLPCLLMLVSIDSSWTSWCHCPLSYCSLGLLILHTRGTQFRYVARSLGPAVLRSIAQG